MSTSDGMQVSPPTVRGTYGSFVQIATCLGIIVSLLIGTPVKDIDGWLEAFCFSPLHAFWISYLWNLSVPMLLLPLAGGECVSGLPLSQRLYKLLVWSFVLRAPSGSIRYFCFGTLLGFYAMFLIYQVKHACLFLWSPIWMLLFFFYSLKMVGLHEWHGSTNLLSHVASVFSTAYFIMTMMRYIDCQSH